MSFSGISAVTLSRERSASRKSGSGPIVVETASPTSLNLRTTVPRNGARTVPYARLARGGMLRHHAIELARGDHLLVAERLDPLERQAGDALAGGGLAHARL